MVRRADLMIVDAVAEMKTFPHAECTEIESKFSELIGLSVARGYTSAVQERFGHDAGAATSSSWRAPSGRRSSSRSRRPPPGRSSTGIPTRRAGAPSASCPTRATSSSTTARGAEDRDGLAARHVRLSRPHGGRDPPPHRRGRLRGAGRPAPRSRSDEASGAAIVKGCRREGFGGRATAVRRRRITSS